jgi:hypothetical protein
VLEGTTLTQIDASNRFACAMDAPGNVYCWGTNDLNSTIGTTDIPSTSYGTFSPTPVLIFSAPEVPGELTMTVPDTATLSSATPGGTATGQLGTVTVTDTREGTGAGSWTVTVELAAPFARTGAPAFTIAAGNVKYTIYDTLTDLTGATPTILNGADAAPPGGVTMSTATSVLESGISGTTVASWDPWVSVSVPRDAVPGPYEATVTHSVT